MSSRERLTGPLDPDRCDDPPPQAGGTATLAEAMQEVARAEARAGAARERALQLSRQAAADADDIDDSAAAAEPASPRWARLRRRPGRKSLAVGTAVVLICTFLGTAGHVVWYHHKTTDDRQRAAEFAAAAQQSVIMLMSIDANKARDDLQRIIDNSTGQFKTSMLVSGNDLVEQVEHSKVSTKVAVKSVAVESMTGDSAVVLVVVKSEATDPDKTKPPPRPWRVVMSLQKDGGQIKMSQVEYM